jgi:hypothetical protein
MGCKPGAMASSSAERRTLLSAIAASPAGLAATSPTVADTGERRY